MLELYYFHGATCGLKARIAMAEKGIAYTHRSVDRSYLTTPEYKKMNPNSVVPTLVHDGNVLIESTIIINYIDEAFDGPSLSPESPLDRARMRVWMTKADNHLPDIGILTYTISMRPKILKKSKDELNSYLNRMPDPERRERRKKILELGVDSPDFQPSVIKLDSLLAEMETVLENETWLSGPHYSLADVALTPFLERLSELLKFKSRDFTDQFF